jgi:predicted anti-sigma-YlaC factor YlaD
MTECERMSDRMPLVARGAATWSGAEAAHLAECEACAAEWRLVGAALGLGAGIALRESPDAMAAALLGRLRAVEAEDRRRRRAMAAVSWGGLALAASLLLALLLRSPGASPAAATDSVEVAVSGTAPFAVSLPELEDADAEELQAVLDAFDAPLGESAPLDRGGMADVEADDLRRVLRAWEG